MLFSTKTTSIPRVILDDRTIAIDFSLGKRKNQMLVYIKLYRRGQKSTKVFISSSPSGQINIAGFMPSLQVPPSLAFTCQFDVPFIHDPLHDGLWIAFCGWIIFGNSTIAIAGFRSP